MKITSDSTTLNPADHPWLAERGLRAIFSAFTKAGKEARVVGGAVRNALMGLPVADVDLAANAPPEEAEEILHQAGIRTKRTGFAHGTITAIANKHGYEITSLRHDLDADGRHAAVAYTDVWHEDAARRDFTMNALYVEESGALHDYHGGMEDIALGRVRFIGSPAARITEDYLRILRFFRFYAYYGRGDADAEGLAACTALASGMVQLSRERVTQEWRKLLLAADPLPALALMRDHGILPQILPLELNCPRLAALLCLASDAGFAPRQAALLPQDKQLAPVVRAALRLSNAEQDAVLRLCDPALAVPESAAALPEALYRFGAQHCRDRLLLQAADRRGVIPLPLREGLGEGLAPQEDLPRKLSDLLGIIKQWRKPAFPLQGDDLLQLGLEESPRLGEMLRAVEDWWIAGGFTADKKACLDEARRLIAPERKT